MSKDTLRDYYLGLLPNLTSDFFFFIPRNKITREIIDKMDFLQNKKVYNKALLIDFNEGFIEYVKGESSTNFIYKKSYLDKNIFSLLEKKNEVTDYEFDFVLEKYFELAECLFFMSYWMSIHVAKIGFYDEYTWSIFRIQSQNYKKHFEVLVKKFYPSRETIPKGDFNRLELIDKYFPDIKSLFDKQKKKPELIKDKKEEDKNENKIDGSKRENIKKEALISESEAEKILLKAIFKLDIDDIN